MILISHSRRRAVLGCHAYAKPWACHSRSGAALIGTVVVLAVLVLLMSAITFQIVRHRRYLDHRHHQAQAQWLARAGIERAAAAILTSSKLDAESFEVIPLGDVRIEVKRDKEIFRVTSEGKYPSDLPNHVVREATRNFRRIEADGKVRLEVVP